MEEKIKESYKRVRMPEEAKERISREIRQSGQTDEKREKTPMFSGRWKAGLAACLGLILIIPSGVFAAKKISKYFTVKINGDDYQVEVALDKAETGKTTAEPDKTDSDKKMKYIRVESEFGKEYIKDKDSVYYEQDEDGMIITREEKVEKGTDGIYSFSHKDGFEAGKNFYYNVIYMDQEKDAVLKLYNQTDRKEITVNGHKALLSESVGIKGSRYRSDQNTDYTIGLYVFYEEYGYIIQYVGMQGLGAERLIALAEKTNVIECSEEKACRYQYLSLHHTGFTEQLAGDSKKEEVTDLVKNMGQKLEGEEFSYQVTDVTVSSKIIDTDKTTLDDSNIPAGSRLWDKKGILKPYIRENIRTGDGVSRPEQTVTGTEKVQPKMVYVTMKVKAKKDHVLFNLPRIIFFEKEKGKYYDTDLYFKYNRPEKISDALMDFAPCYFRETEGGKGFRIKKMRKGEEQTYHFAYLVDEDLTDHMFLVTELAYMNDNYVEMKPTGKE